MTTILRIFSMGLLAVAVVAGCSKSDDAKPAAGKSATGKSAAAGPARPKVTLGFIAGSQDNPLFQVAQAAARATASTLADKYNTNIELDIRTPAKESAVEQATAIDSLISSGAAGIAVSVTDIAILTPAINRAADKGIVVMCFGADAPRSKRFAFYGTEELECGKQLMGALAKAMGDAGTLGILAGEGSSVNLQRRATGVREELSAHPKISELNKGKGLFNHSEDPAEAADAWRTVRRTNPTVTGWVLVTGRPLMAGAVPDWDWSKVKVVAMDALPAQLDYLENGSVSMLLAQDSYGWGSKSVEILMEKIVNKKDPATARMIDPLKQVTKENAGEVRKLWAQWLSPTGQ